MKVIFPLLLLMNLCFIRVVFGGEKLRITTLVDGVQREYFLHVPSSYNNAKSIPLVFMLHGTGGDGEKMYDNSGWAELAETDGFIAVFPSSLRYRIISQEEDKNTTKWNTLPDTEWSLQSGQVAKDDIRFLRKIIDEIKAKYTIDEKKVYLSGFSNGGQMAAKSSIEMSDIFAAVCMNAGSFYLDTTYIPKMKIPVLYQVGDRDYGPGNVGPEFPPIPLTYFDSLLKTPDLPFFNGRIYNVKNRIINNFKFSQKFILSGDTNRAMVALFLPELKSDNHEFQFVYVKNLAHSYPNWAPAEHWKWMKKFSKNPPNAGKYSLTIQEGYGSGVFDNGEKIHIWSKQIDGKVFTHWSGDIQYLSDPNEYHSIVNMPAKNVSLTANYANLTPRMQMNPFKIKAAQREKNIFVYTPADKNLTKGVVWLFHGTNGNAQQFINDPDVSQLIDLLMIKNYGVVALTSEESEFKLDFNGDGVYRYTYGLDSTLTDIANVRIIRDSLIRRNLIMQSTPHVAIGWSAGGAFSEIIANSLGWKAAVNHTSPGIDSLSVSPKVKVPYLASINENDRNPDVGLAGNEQTKKNIQNYKNRGACALLHEHLMAPLYPERFDRAPSITEDLSRSLFRELKTNEMLDSLDYLKLLANPLFTFIENNLSRFPVYARLTPEQKNAMQRQIQVLNAEHNIKADINGLTLNFIENACGNVTSLNQNDKESITIFPNPAITWVSVNKEVEYKIYNYQGILMQKGKSRDIEVSYLVPGVYIFDADGYRVKLLKL